LTKIGLITLATALALLAGLAHAADKITLSCSGTQTSSKAPLEPMSFGPDGVIIDLDRGVLIWGTDTFPIVSNVGSIIWFDGKAKVEEDLEESWKGWIDRVLGTLHATNDYDAGWAKHPAPITLTYDLTCKPAKPLF
jgi:hypothetical protein